MLTHLEINNFKSIRSLSLDLGPINVFIGANGAGKKPWFWNHSEIDISGIKVKKSGGGLSHFGPIKKDLLNLLKQEKSGAIISTFFDYYALPGDFPDSKVCCKNVARRFKCQATPR